MSCQAQATKTHGNAASDARAIPQAMLYCWLHGTCESKLSRGIPSPTFCSMAGIEFGMTRSLAPQVLLRILAERAGSRA